MMKFKDFIDYDNNSFMLSEKLITFGGKAYPKFNNVVILAGGAGSGKGFTLSNLLGIEGKIFDVDALKSIALRAPKLLKKIKNDLGIDLKNSDLRNPEDVRRVHEILGDELKISNKSQSAMFNSILTANIKRKPNLIFDVTLKSVNKLRKISGSLINLGYKRENIHIVWVLNSVDVALAQNQKRNRVVPEDIFIQTHEGVSLTMKLLLSNANDLSKYMDGDFWISANIKGVDSKMAFSGKHGKRFDGSGGAKGSMTSGGSYITDTNYWKIKKKGEKPQSIKDFAKDLMVKIKDYTPSINTW